MNSVFHVILLETNKEFEKHTSYMRDIAHHCLFASFFWCTWYTPGNHRFRNQRVSLNSNFQDIASIYDFHVISYETII